MGKKRKNRGLIRYTFLVQAKDNRALLFLYSVLSVLIFSAFLSFMIRRNHHAAFLSFLSLALMAIPSFIKAEWKVRIPPVIEALVLFQIVSAEFLGEIYSFYLKFPFWDCMLHTLSGFVSASVGLSICFTEVDIREGRRAIPIVFALCFALSIGVAWEFIEFGADNIFALDMQKDTVVHSINTVSLDDARSGAVISFMNIERTVVNDLDLGLNGYLDIGLIDTMKDLFMDAIGSILFILAIVISIRRKRLDAFLSKLLLSQNKEEDDFRKSNNE